MKSKRKKSKKSESELRPPDRSGSIGELIPTDGYIPWYDVGKTQQDCSRYDDDYSESLEDLYNDPSMLKRPDRLSPALAFRSRLTLFYNVYKQGKSHLAASDIRDACLCGWSVLWISADEPLEDIVSRFKEIGVNGKLVRILHYPRTYMEIDIAIRKHEPDIIYIDSKTSVLKSLGNKIPETNQPEEWAGLMMQFEAMAQEFKAAVVIIDHSNAAGGLRGSTANPGVVDMIARMETNKSAKLATITYEGRWKVDTIQAEFLDPGYKFGAYRTGQSRLADEIYITLESGQFSRKELLERFKCSPAMLGRAIGILKQNGKIKVSKGCYERSI